MTALHDPKLQKELEAHVEKRAPGLMFYTYRCSLDKDTSCRLRPKYAIPHSPAPEMVHFELPARIKEINLLPETKMWVFMNLIEHPTKRAKPDDWKLLIDEQIWRHFSEYLREPSNTDSVRGSPDTLRSDQDL